MISQEFQILQVGEAKFIPGSPAYRCQYQRDRSNPGFWHIPGPWHSLPS